jgi:hypothetical protein
MHEEGERRRRYEEGGTPEGEVERTMEKTEGRMKGKEVKVGQGQRWRRW